MNTISLLSIIAFSALIHASFQLSVSVLTLLSGHTIGSKKSHNRLIHMTSSFIFGAFVMTILLLATFTVSVQSIFNNQTPVMLWSIACGLLVGVAIAIWLFYYRREKGTSLWIPRGVAEYLTDRTKDTKSVAEAFGLGLSSVIGEIFFIAAPLLISALSLINLPFDLQIFGLVLYAAISMFSLLTVWALIGNGVTLGKIQKWRESNKYFLQFAAGLGLIVLSFFIYVNQILTTVVGAI